MVNHNLNKSIKRLIILFIIGLVASGLTALPLEWQLNVAKNNILSSNSGALKEWLNFVYTAVHETNKAFPFISYGTDWLAFAHFMIAIAFIGPLRDPVRNIWIIEFGLIACLCIFPFAFVAGEVRGIPIYWRLIDCSFGVFGGLLLWRCHNKIKMLELQSQNENDQ
jgi:hypothetical protein